MLWSRSVSATPSAYPASPWSSSGPETPATGVVGSESWLTGWHPCQVATPLYPILLGVTVDGCCSNHLPDLLIPDHVSSGLVCCFSETSHLASVNLSFKGFVEGPSLTLVDQRWYKNRADQPGLCFYGNAWVPQEGCKLVAFSVGLLYA